MLARLAGYDWVPETTSQRGHYGSRGNNEADLAPGQRRPAGGLRYVRVTRRTCKRKQRSLRLWPAGTAEVSGVMFSYCIYETLP